ncbi:MAG: MBL fold metallo-hydrolase [Tannerella sp.]|jgi:glyoxylase-like metal-dependent hydrolase (beta-lactamase superfamily II)|nr:MBL fold metallo-hydrolase [Tannerella sp.]
MFKILTTGKFYADGGAMFGAVPKTVWKRLYPVNERNLCVLAMNTGLVVTPAGRVVVVDPGVGLDYLNQQPAKFYGFHEMQDLAVLLRREGVETDDVTDVVFTHLHFDHASGAVCGGKPLFPNARHIFSRRQYEVMKTPFPLEKYSFLPESIEIIMNAGLCRMVSASTGTDGLEDFNIEFYNGHTDGQIVVTLLHDGIENVCFPGDVIPLASHKVLERISAYDLNPMISYSDKETLLRNIKSSNAVTVYYHDVFKPLQRF